jgi:uncharacterized Tic20 family protein
MQEAREEMSVNGKAVDSETVEIPTSEWTTASLAHASVLVTVILGTPAGIGVPVGLAVPLVMYLSYRKQSRFIALHALQAFAYQLAGTLVVATLGVLVAVAWTVSGSLAAVLIGLALMPLAMTLTLLLAGAAIAWLVYGLYAAYQVYQGRDFRYWLIGEWLEREVKL